MGLLCMQALGHYVFCFPLRTPPKLITPPLGWGGQYSSPLQPPPHFPKTQTQSSAGSALEEQQGLGDRRLGRKEREITQWVIWDGEKL